MYIIRAFGMPDSFHPLTDGILMSNSLATSAVSPRASMILVACSFMPTLLGVANELSIATPKILFVRLFGCFQTD